MVTMKICRNQRGGLFLCTLGTVYNKVEDIWTECIGHPLDCDSDYQDVTFENSPREVELKLIKPRKKPEPYNPEYVEFEGVVTEVYKDRALHCNYSVFADTRFFFDGYSRDFALKQGAFTKATRPKVGDRVLLRYRKTKKHGSNREYFDFIKAKIVKVL